MSVPEIRCAPHLAEWKNKLSLWLETNAKKLSLPPGIIFATSGSSGKPVRGVLLSENALQSSALAVNNWLGIQKGDNWILPLPPYHIGGYMVLRRAQESDGKIFIPNSSAPFAPNKPLPDLPKWDPEKFADCAQKSQAFWSSLVPTQVEDLVAQKISAKNSALKCIIVGGGTLRQSTGEAARKLGWPVVQSYGMSEAASQIATALPQNPFSNSWLPVLPHWKIDSTQAQLCISGPALFSGIITQDSPNDFSWNPRLEKFWQSQDLVEFNAQENTLRFIRRADRVVKRLGILIDLDEIELFLKSHDPEAIVLDIANDREGCQIIAVSPNKKLLEFGITSWNMQAISPAKIQRFYYQEIPKTPLGKIDRRALASLFVAR